MTTNTQFNQIGLICLGVFILCAVELGTVGQTLKTEVNGVIISIRYEWSKGANPKRATEYTIRSDDGKIQTYWARHIDASVPKTMPVGTRIRKQRWHLEYEVNGQHVEFSSSYGLMLAVGLGMIVCGFIILKIYSLSFAKVDPLGKAFFYHEKNINTLTTNLRRDSLQNQPVTQNDRNSPAKGDRKY